MKNRFLSIAIVAFFIAAFAACKQKESQLAVFIPKDAAAVFEIDIKSISDKINSSGITIDSLANLFNKNEEGFHWNDLKNSGIDLEKSFYVFTKQATSMQTGKTESFGLVAAVKDKNAVENFLKKESKNTAVKSADKYQYLTLEKNSIAGWNDDVLVISGTINTSDSAAFNILNGLFTQKESASVASINEFNDMLAKPGDMHFWINPSGSLNAMPMLGMTKASQLFEGSYTEGAIDFQNGKAVASIESHINNTLSDMLKKYPAKEIKTDMLTRFPDSLNGFGIVAFNPKLLFDILHFLGFDVMADSYVGQMGFTVNDVLNAFSGDIAVMFSRGAGNSSGDFTPHTTGFLLNFAVGDKAAFDKVVTALTNKGILSKNGDQYQLGMAGGHGFVIETTNDALLIGSGDELIKSYEAGAAKKALPADVEKEMNYKSMAMYIDINSLLNKTSVSDTSRRHILDMAQATFKNFIATTDKGNGKTIASNAELNFVNNNENSLAALVKFMAATHEEGMKYNKWNMHPPMPPHMPMDSTQPENDNNDD